MMNELKDPVIFQDLDGCLADFERGVKEVTGKFPHEQKMKDMWSALARTDEFYANLDWMSDGKNLWDFVKKFNPTILTGVPMGRWASGQKRNWCGRELGWDVPVITGWAKEKHIDAMNLRGTDNLNGAILIDDREKTKAAWEQSGGVFLLHTSTASTLALLKKMGI